MTTQHYSDNELSFFNQLLREHNIRIDGRNRMELRSHSLTSNVIKSCFASTKLSYNNFKNEIIFAIKGELTSLTPTVSTDVLSLSIDSMHKAIDNQKMKNQIETMLNNLILSKINITPLQQQNDTQLIWKLYIDIFIFDELRLDLIQLLSIGLKQCLSELKLPKMICFYNELTNAKEYDLLSNYEELTFEQNESSPSLAIPNVYAFSVINNDLLLDPSNEEWKVSNCVIFISTLNTEIIHIQSIGNNIEPVIILKLKEVIKSIETA
jgi:exosome complex RNA-binding protein Rrp42 (RNase PH superfamily)